MDFSSFQCVIFRCKWWDTFDQNNVKEDYDSGMISINSRKMWHEAREAYVFPKHYNQVCFYPYLLDRDWRIVSRHDPRSKHIFENNNVIMKIEEDNQGDDNGEWYVIMLFHHLYYCCMFMFSLSRQLYCFVFILLAFYNIIGKIHKCFYTFSYSGSIFTVLKTKYFQFCTLSIIIRIQGHNPSQIGKWEKKANLEIKLKI